MNLKTWAKQHKNILIGFGVFLILMALEHVVLFGSYYRHLGSVIGSEGDSYFNISLWMQNLVNWSQGAFLSFEGDHMAMYHNPIGVTEHVISTTFVFRFLWTFVENPILIFNLIFFGNVVLEQIGIFFLVRYYTKNNAISIFAGLFVILGQAVVLAFYVGHIHASLFAPLPFLILLFEVLYSKKVAAGIRELWPYALGIFVCFLALLFADWHVAIFSSVWIGLWLVFHLGIFKNARKNFPKILAFAVPLLLAVLLLLPVAKKYIDSSDIFNAERTIDVVVQTNYNLENYLGFAHVLTVANDVVRPFFAGHEGALKRLDHYRQATSSATSDYPDRLFIATFWLIVIFGIPVLVFGAWKLRKKETFRRLLVLGAVIFATSLIMIGPAIKINGRLAFETIPLPYFFLYDNLYPLHSIRGLWRVAAVGSFAVTILWSIIVARLWNYFKNSKAGETFFSKEKSAKRFRVFMTVFVLFLVLGAFVYQNNGWRAKYTPASTKDEFLHSAFLTHSEAGATSSFAVVTDDYESGNYNLQTSWFNFLQGERRVELAAGGIGGYLPMDWLLFKNFTQERSHLNELVDACSAKHIDFLIENRLTIEDDVDGGAAVHTALSRHYAEAESNHMYRVWVLESQVESLPQENVKYSLALSGLQSSEQNWKGFVNIENDSNQIFAQDKKVAATPFALEIYNGDILETTEFSVGEQAVLFAHSGISIPVDLDINIWPGAYSLDLFRDGEVVWSGNIEVVEDREYLERIEFLEKQTLAFDSEVTPAPFPLKRYAIPMKFSLSLSAGAIVNSPKHRIVRSNKTITATFEDALGNLLPLSKDLEEPDCRFAGNLVAGDDVNFWCYQYQPVSATQANATAQVQ